METVTVSREDLMKMVKRGRGQECAECLKRSVGCAILGRVTTLPLCRWHANLWVANSGIEFVSYSRRVGKR